MKRLSLIISLIVGGTFLMQTIDGTAITTAIPQMAEDFAVSTASMSMGITAYVIMVAIFIPVSGWVADRFGVKKVFSAAIVGFVLSSVLCGFSNSFPTFIASRVLQGIAGALMVPVGQLAVLSHTDKKDLVTAIALITWPGLIGPILGPFIGGYFTTYQSWHWIFFINIPLGAIALLLAFKYIPSRTETNQRKLDWKGFLLSSLGLLSLILVFELTAEELTGKLTILALFLLSAVLIGLSVWRSINIDSPLIDFSVVKIKTFRVNILSGSLIRIVMNTAPYLLPLFFQLGFGLNAFDAGLLYMASMTGNLAMKPATIWITRKFNFRVVLIVNGILLALAVFLQSYLQPETPYLILIPLLFFSGMTRSMQFSSLNTLAFADVPQASMSHANTLANTMQQISIAIGVATGAILLHLAASFHNTASGHYAVVDFQLALKITAIMALISVVEYFSINKYDGLNVRNKEKN